SRLRQLLETNPKAGERATHAYLDTLAYANQAAELRRFVKLNEAWLKSSDFTWGAVAYALTVVRDYRGACRWTRDWRSRPDAEPWMLANVAEGLRGVGRNEEAREVNEAAVAKPAGNGTPEHRLWLAT